MIDRSYVLKLRFNKCSVRATSLVFLHLGFSSRNFFLIAPFPGHCLLSPFLSMCRCQCQIVHTKTQSFMQWNQVREQKGLRHNFRKKNWMPLLTSQCHSSNISSKVSIVLRNLGLIFRTFTFMDKVMFLNRQKYRKN